jgi:hypothetical protein
MKRTRTTKDETRQDSPIHQDKTTMNYKSIKAKETKDARTHEKRKRSKKRQEEASKHEKGG